MVCCKKKGAVNSRLLVFSQPPEKWFTLLAVIVEALAGLAAQQTAADHLLKQQSRTILGIAGLAVKNVHDSQADVQTDEIAQFQRAWWII